VPGCSWTYISSMLLILPAFTRRPSLVTGCHSFSCANCQFCPGASDAARAYLALAAAATTSTTTAAATVSSTVSTRSESTTAARCSSVSHVVCDLVGRLRTCAVRECFYKACGCRETYSSVFLRLADVATFDGFVGGTNFEVQCVMACAAS
jgi:hypothetical protein